MNRNTQINADLATSYNKNNNINNFNNHNNLNKQNKANNYNNHLLPGRLSFESTIPKNVVYQMNDALVQNMDLLDEQAMHIHSAAMQNNLTSESNER
jgi:hypothetical protein